jgi:radical SAM superfamily enzyme YgiQ (UPF0313 family)
MVAEIRLMILNLPNPPHRIIDRDYAGGFGIARHLPRFRRRHSGRPSLNLFLPYSAAVAEKIGCEYKILDAQALELTAKEAMQKTKRFNPDIVISMISLPSIYEDKKLLSDIKTELPNTLVVGCGTVCNVMPEEILHTSKIDLLLRGSFPYVDGLTLLLNSFQSSKKKTTLEDLPGSSYKKGSDVRNNPPKPTEKQFVDYTPLYNVLPLKKYQYFTDLEGEEHLFIPILGSEGCPHSCMYCPYPIGFGRKPIFKHFKHVVDEIESLQQMGIEGFLFRNQSFTLDQEWAKNVCNEIINRKLDVSWLCEARVDETSKTILALMHKAGCKTIDYGVETGDPTLIRIAKPGAYPENTYVTFKNAKETGIWRHAHVILGLPGENQETLKRTHRYLLKLDPESVSLNFATPYPGTKMYEIAERNNWIITHNWTYYSSFDVVMTPPNLNAEDLYKMAMQIEKSLLMQKSKQHLSHARNLNVFKLVANNYVQILMTYLRFKSNIRKFHKRIDKKYVR